MLGAVHHSPCHVRCCTTFSLSCWVLYYILPVMLGAVQHSPCHVRCCTTFSLSCCLVSRLSVHCQPCWLWPALLSGRCLNRLPLTTYRGDNLIYLMFMLGGILPVELILCYLSMSSFLCCYLTYSWKGNSYHRIYTEKLQR